MRTFALLSILLASGCADVEHTLVRLEGGAIAYRLAITPYEAVSWATDPAIDALPSAPGAAVRGWTEASAAGETVVVQGRFESVSAFADWTAASLAEARKRWGVVPAAFVPPLPTERGESDTWDVSLQLPASDSAYHLRLAGGPVQPPAPVQLSDGTQEWSFDPGTPPIMQAAIRPGNAMDLMTWVSEGGPSAAAALAGLALLLWVNRRMRRRRYRRRGHA